MLSRFAALIIAFVLLIGFVTAVAQNYDDVQYTTVKAAENIYMLQGAGGNIGLFFGPDGIFLIDDQFAPLHPKLIAAIGQLTGDSIPDMTGTFLINTHFHGDHTGGNELMGNAGAIIVAHKNTRQRLSVDQSVPFFDSRNPALPAGALPVITFSRDITFHLNGDSINIIHMSAAHTDGDAVVHFTGANVIHAGDIVFMQTYPFIDLDNGGSVAGTIKAVGILLSLCNNETKIIPGHGNMTDRAGMTQYYKMLTTSLENVRPMVADGKTLEQIRAAKPTQEFDSQFNGFISSDAFVGFLYRELSEK